MSKVCTGSQETPRSLPPVTLWEDTLRYVNRRSLVHDEAESGLESGRDMQKLRCRAATAATVAAMTELILQSGV